MRAPLIEAFQEFVADPASDELSAALLVNKVLDAGVDVRAVRSSVDELAAECPAGADPWVYLRDRGFHGNRADYQAPANSCIDAVLQQRTGIPISLGVLLVHVARGRGHRARGVNFPSHFLTRIDDVLVDPFEFQAVTEAECLERLAAPRPGGDPFQTATSSMIAMRMITNVKIQCMAELRWSEALDLLDYQMVLAPGEVALHLERGEVWEQMDVGDLAREAYAEAERLATDPRLRAVARSKIEALDDDPTVWN